MVVEDGQGGRLLFLMRVWKLELEAGRMSNCVGKPIFFIFDLIGTCLRLMVDCFDLMDAHFDLIDTTSDLIQCAARPNPSSTHLIRFKQHAPVKAFKTQRTSILPKS
ncbi:hypothetical protein ABE65_003665 [Fictibacillus phosphorivorans]|uniref:Uncharacterized protein n=1 Tax=Fictibacillus phosphorivorans TaxID=1221500 RepID=A0A161IIH3_9BACL|nr:hypothetical protein ABE65_003665 [Fictibacillus phosphorivorans]